MYPKHHFIPRRCPIIVVEKIPAAGMIPLKGQANVCKGIYQTLGYLGSCIEDTLAFTFDVLNVNIKRVYK